MPEFIAAVKQMFVQLLLWIAFVAVSLFATGRFHWFTGFLLGASASIVNFGLLSYRVYKSSHLTIDRMALTMRSNWLGRLSLIVLVLIVSLRVEGVNFLAAVAGLFSLQIIIVVTAAYSALKHYASGRR